MKQINSATLERYNANNRGKSVGDCVKRAISIAFDIPYSEVGKLLVSKMKELRRTQWNIWPVFEKVIKDLGGTIKQAPSQDMTVADFADNFADPNRTYVLLVGKKYPQTSHLVTVRDGKIWDSWDCSDYYVARYYEVSDSVQHKEFTDIKDHLAELTDDYIFPILNAEREKQIKKYGWLSGSCSYSSSFKAYAVTTTWKQILVPDLYIPKNRTYSFQIAFPFEPTMTVDDAIKFIQTTGKTRMYDRLYAINEQEKKLKEEYLMHEQLGTKPYDTTYLSAQEEKFYNSLPGWARALVRHIRISDPGQFHDSYELEINKLPADDTHPEYEYYNLVDYDADGIRKQLTRYAKYGEIADIDYERDW